MTGSFPASSDGGKADESPPSSQSDKIRVPGSRASTYTGAGFFNGVFRKLLRVGSGLGHFARSLVSHDFAYCTTMSTASTTNLPAAGFPMPLPFPEVMKDAGDSGGVSDSEAALKRGVNSIVLVLDYLHLGRPRRAPSYLRIGARLRQKQWDTVSWLKECARVWIETEAIGPSEMGRGASKVESIEGLVGELSRRASEFGLQSTYDSKKLGAIPAQLPPSEAAGHIVGQSRSSSLTAFKTIEPSRLQFLGAPTFDPRPYLDPLTRAVFEDPDAFAVPLQQYTGELPRVRVHSSYDKKIQLFRMLDQTHRLKLLPPKDVNPALCAGLFSVVKNAQKDRLILDARPRNCLELPVERWIGSLASAEALCSLVLPHGHEFRASSNDLRDFYYFFSVGGARAARNVFAGAVRTQDLKGMNALTLELSALPYVYGSLSSLAMGDLQAVAIAQTCHVGMGIQHHVFRPGQLLSGRGPIPRGPNYTGIVIDDFVSISAVPVGASGPSVAAKQADHINEIYHEVGLIPHDEKATREEVISEFWGAHLDGSRGLLRGSLRRAIPLAHIAMDVARLGYSSVELLQTLAGSFISLLLFRRRLLSIISAIFQAIRGRSARDIVRLSGEVRSELCLLAILLPMACTNLRAPVSHRITATDASQWGEGAVEATIPGLLAAEAHRLILRKSVWTKLLTPGKAWERMHGQLEAEMELPEGEECFKSNPFWEILAEVPAYSEVFSRPARRPRHINIGELRAVVAAEQRLGRMSAHRRELFGIDSQVTLGALLKGRSASTSLNRVLQQSVPNMLGFDIYLEPMYFETSRNRADGPSRGATVPPPSRQAPSWWQEVERGDFERFDRWRAHYSIDDHTLSGLPDFAELNQGVPLRPPLSVEFEAAEFEVEPRETVTPTEIIAEVNYGAIPPATAWPEIAAALSTFNRKQVVLGKGRTWPPQEPGFLDLYSGTRGVPRALRQLGASWTLCFDIAGGQHQDLGVPALQEKLMWLLRSGAFIGMGAAPMCSSFSTAVTPPIRSSLEPYGMQSASGRMQERMREGNAHALWTLRMAQACHELQIGFWVENPASSWMFRLPEWESWVRDAAEVDRWVVDFCQYKAPWRKRTAFICNLAKAGTNRLCQGDHPHIQLRGRSRVHQKLWTLVAQPYPAGLARDIAAQLLDHSRKSALCCTSSCAFQSCSRVGEAKNPGPPRRRLVSRTGELEAVPLVSERTVALQQRV